LVVGSNPTGPTRFAGSRKKFGRERQELRIVDAPPKSRRLFFPWTVGFVEIECRKIFSEKFLKTRRVVGKKTWHTLGTLDFKKAQLRATDFNTALKLSAC
jgi:hypothetical protein